MSRGPLAHRPVNPDKIGMRLGAIILAGGRSTRMGRPKESLPFRGDSLLGSLCTPLLGCTEVVVVVARDAAQPLPPLPEAVIRIADRRPGRGPLEGVATGLHWLATTNRFADDDAAFVTACDHPLLTAAAVRGLAAALGRHDAVMPRQDGGLQPLCAVYRLSVLRAVDRLGDDATAGPSRLAKAGAVLALDEADVRAFDPTWSCLRTVNTPADYEALRQRPDA